MNTQNREELSAYVPFGQSGTHLLMPVALLA